MKDLGEESNLWGSHGIVVWEEELQLENAAYISRQYRWFCLRRLGEPSMYLRMVRMQDRGSRRQSTAGYLREAQH